MRNTAASCCTAPPRDGANLACRKLRKTRGGTGTGVEILEDMRVDVCAREER
jgi:hypothetical protein